MFDSTLGGNRIELLLDVLRASNDVHAVLGLYFGLEDSGCCEHPKAILPEHLQQRAVCELAGDRGLDVLLQEPRVERATNRRRVQREEEWCTVQRRREVLPIARRQVGRSEDRRFRSRRADD